MPRKTVYPQWVRDYCQPGQSVKKVGDKYYLYETTSVKKDGFKNPQPQSKYIGVITPEGIRYSSRRVVNTEVHPEWYEYGFTRCIYDLCYEVLIKEFRKKELAESVLLNIIRQLSPRSYRLKDKVIPDPEDLHICICNQIKKIEEKKKIQFDELIILKDVLLIELDGRKIITAANDVQTELSRKLGVNLYA